LGVLASKTDPAFLDAYDRYYAAKNVWAQGMASAPVGRIVQSEEICDTDELLKTEFYNDCLRTQDFVAATGTVLHRTSDRFLFLSGNMRPQDLEHVRMPLARMFALLGPHISQSFELMRHIPGLVEGEDYRLTAERSPNALFFLDRRGRLVHANRSGRTMHSEASMVRVDRDGRFHLHDPQAEKALQAALDAITRIDFQKLRGNFQIRRASGLPVQATIAPIERNAAPAIFDQIFEGLPIAALVLKNQTNAATALQGYGLTPAELVLAQSIASGLSVREYADSRAVSIHTVRTQLKAAFAKTGTTRQSQLVALMLRG
jgi:DNA-binding CsgD family transcriptional regulator